MDRIVREAFETEVHLNNMNRDIGFVSAGLESFSFLPQEISVTGRLYMLQYIYIYIYKHYLELRAQQKAT
jgi:hypothetical protein